MRREERVTVQGPVKEQQPDGMSHRGLGFVFTRAPTFSLAFFKVLQDMQAMPFTDPFGDAEMLWHIVSSALHVISGA